MPAKILRDKVLASVCNEGSQFQLPNTTKNKILATLGLSWSQYQEATSIHPKRTKQIFNLQHLSISISHLKNTPQVFFLIFFKILFVFLKITKHNLEYIFFLLLDIHNFEKKKFKRI